MVLRPAQEENLEKYAQDVTSWSNMVVSFIVVCSWWQIMRFGLTSALLWFFCISRCVYEKRASSTSVIKVIRDWWEYILNSDFNSFTGTGVMYKHQKPKTYAHIRIFLTISCLILSTHCLNRILVLSNSIDVYYSMTFLVSKDLDHKLISCLMALSAGFSGVRRTQRWTTWGLSQPSRGQQLPGPAGAGGLEISAAPSHCHLLSTLCHLCQ